MSAAPFGFPVPALPDSLIELDQWGLWQYETVNGRRTKVPYSVRGHKASSSDPRTWGTFDEAVNSWRKNPRRYAGLAFFFARDGGLVGIDLDDCLTADLSVKPWACGIVERFADSYCEISPSGEGLKIWARGTLPANVPGVKVGDGSIEAYHCGRYFAVTGLVFRGAPLQIEDHGTDLLMLYDRLCGSRKGWHLQPLQGGRIPHGQQHSTLVSLAGTLRARRICDEAVDRLAFVRREGRDVDQPGNFRVGARLRDDHAAIRVTDQNRGAGL